MVVVIAAVLAVLAPRLPGASAERSAGATESSPARELPLVVEADVVRTYASDPSGVRVDPWVVWVCHVDPGGPVPERVPMTAVDAVGVLDTRIAPYFAWLSGGAYHPTFAPGGSLAGGSDDAGAAVASCVADALDAPVSAGFAGALVITDAPVETAFATSGHRDCDSPPCAGSTTLPDNRRSVQLGAHDLFETETMGSPALAVAAHELGHAIDWGHAAPDARYQPHQPGQPGYVPTAADAAWLDQIDPALVAAFDELLTAQGLPTIEADRAALGSASVDCDEMFGLDASLVTPASTDGLSLCILLSVLSYGDLFDLMGSTPSPLTPETSAIPQTNVFNRYAAGWLSADEVGTHRGGVAEYDVAPIGREGLQMLAVPGDDERRYLTVEARAATPFLSGDEHAGVLVHLVEQRPHACGEPTCWGDADWTTTVVGSSPWSRGQLLRPGDAVAIEGVSVEVVSGDADGTYHVRVTPRAGAGPVPSEPAAVATPVARRPAFAG